MRATWQAPLVFVGAYALLTAAAYLGDEAYLTAWLPLLGGEVDWLLPSGFVRDGLTLVNADTQRLIELRTSTIAPITVGHETLPSGGGVRTTTLQAYALHHPILVYATLAAWPVRTWRRRVLLLLLGAPCVVITTSLDIPFVLVGLVQDLLLANLAPERLTADPRALYYAFLHGGGRLGLALVGALIVAVSTTRADDATRGASP